MCMPICLFTQTYLDREWALVIWYVNAVQLGLPLIDICAWRLASLIALRLAAPRAMQHHSG